MYIIYGKNKNERFKAINLAKQDTVNEVSNASMFDETKENENALQEIVQELSQLNKGWRFEVRRLGVRK